MIFKKDIRFLKSHSAFYKENQSYVRVYSCCLFILCRVSIVCVDLCVVFSMIVVLFVCCVLL
jgi:hypothetical protein